MFGTSKLLNINDATKRIGNFFKLPIQLFHGVPYPELAFLVKQGSKSSHIYFITDGLFRCLCETNGNEDTICFGVAGHPFLSVHTLAHDEPAAEK